MSGRAAGIAAGAVLDAAIGDPRRGHPVAGFGRVAAGLERRVWAPRRAVGAAYAGTLVAGAALGAGLAERLAPRRATLALVLWTTLGGRSLAREGLRLAALVERGDLEGARRRLPALAGRDPRGLDGPELCRAAIESVAENTADAVVGPLLWCAVAGAPGAAGYRAANTLDAMVGHRTPRHERFGWAAARLDDVATWPAARLGALLACALAPVAGGDTARALAVLRRDGAGHRPGERAQPRRQPARDLRGRDERGGRDRHHRDVEQGPAPDRVRVADTRRARRVLEERHQHQRQEEAGREQQRGHALARAGHPAAHRAERDREDQPEGDAPQAGGQDQAGLLALPRHDQAAPVIVLVGRGPVLVDERRLQLLEGDRPVDARLGDRQGQEAREHAGHQARDQAAKHPPHVGRPA